MPGVQDKGAEGADRGMLWGLCGEGRKEGRKRGGSEGDGWSWKRQRGDVSRWPASARFCQHLFPRQARPHLRVYWLIVFFLHLLFIHVEF